VKWKVALLLLAALSASAPMGSAQTPPPSQRNLLVPDPAPYVNADPLVHSHRGSYSINSFYSISDAQSHEEVQLANQANEVAHQLGSAKSDADREKLKTQLSTVLEKQFEFRQQRHKKEIESLEAQVKKLRDLVDKRQENRREIVAKRLDQILQESQGLGW
jgi:hypothetical protein